MSLVMCNIKHVRQSLWRTLFAVSVSCTVTDQDMFRVFEFII